MKIIRGLDAGRKVLCSRRGLRLDSVPPHMEQMILDTFGKKLTPIQVVDRILSDVRNRGDTALHELCHKLEGTDLETFEVPKSAIKNAYSVVPDKQIHALEEAAGRIRKFHDASLPKSWVDITEGYGELVHPVERVGVYVPGGTARYPSTVLMTAVPAKSAGVGEIIVSTPGNENMPPHPIVLVAANIAGVDRVFRIGGAQAIAAMAYGTETVPRMDLICGPGNIFVTLAKKLLFGEVGIDGLYGPTETMVVADNTANPTLCAADLVAQAEHDAMATAVLITTSDQLAKQVMKETVLRASNLERSRIAQDSLEHRGYIVVLRDLEEALNLANEFSPEHISLMVKDPWQYAGWVRNAGAVFLGEFSHEVLGDYVAGPSHVMPTGGTARFSSGLSTRSFIKISPVVGLDETTSAALAGTASVLGRAEGLTGHAQAAEVREELIKSPLS